MELRRVLFRINLRIGRRIPGLGLTTPQTSALATLLDHAPVRIGELAEHERVRMPTITSTVNGLEKFGLVRRLPDAHDRRVVLVELSPRGRELIGKVAEDRHHHLAQLLGDLSADDRADTAAALPALTGLLIVPDQPEASKQTAPQPACTHWRGD